ncbi:MAG: TrkH family potassium uptake protein [Candidatus Altiarchaeota archaeon]
MSLPKIAPYVGVFLKVNALIILLPAVVALFYGEDATPFVVGGALSFLAGAVLSRMPQKELSVSDAVVLSAAAFVVVSLFGAVPFLYWFGVGSGGVVDAFFESVSGYTTTGLSVIDDLNGYGLSLLFYRSLMQWIGGIGIIVLSFSTLSEGLASLYLYRQEQDSNRFLPSVRRSAKMIIKIYLFYSLAGFILLWISGMDAFSSVNNVFTSLSTGGFAASDVVYTGFASKVLIVLLMVAGGFSFTVHYRLFSGELGKVLRDIEVKAIMLLLLVGVMVFTGLFMVEGFGLSDAAGKAFFNSVSAVTTTGYSDIDFSSVSELTKVVTSVFMIIGGGLGSTAGGLKVIRVVILVYGVFWFARKTANPPSVVLPFKLGGRALNEHEFGGVWLYFFAYIMVLFAGMLFLMLDGVSAVDGFFVSSSALGTVGLSTVKISSLSMASKILLSAQMLAGRVEIISMLVLVVHVFAPSKRNSAVT